MAIQPGSILRGHYRIDALVGGGGMALVYRAFDLNLQRVCAIKQNLDSSPEAQQQFYVEAIVLANLSHPHLARVTDHFVDTTGQQYLVMDFVEGEDLEAYVRRTGPMAERQTLAWISGVFDALSYCHGKGVIHRDIKPANLVKRRGEDTVVLVDFGIAKSQAGGMTLAGARAASPTYAPLEQFSGHTDPRSDVYALGATLYYLLTGREPPDARLVAAGVERITPPRALNPAISPQTEQAVLQALALRVADRPQTVAGLRAALAVVQPPPAPRAWQAGPHHRAGHGGAGAAGRAGACALRPRPAGQQRRRDCDHDDRRSDQPRHEHTVARRCPGDTHPGCGKRNSAGNPCCLDLDCCLDRDLDGHGYANSRPLPDIHTQCHSHADGATAEDTNPDAGSASHTGAAARLRFGPTPGRPDGWSRAEQYFVAWVGLRSSIAVGSEV